MKKLPLFLLAATVAGLAFAADAAKKAAAPMVPASAGKITAPLVLKDGAIGQPAQTELAEGGKAVFEFTVPAAGDYVIHAIVSAPAEDANSFYLNIDALPEDPVMIWDIDVTNGFEERVVSWRGKNDPDNDEFKPKIFKLTAGAHKLHLVGREPAQLQGFSVRPAK
jgi:hypothetical protein